MPTADELLNAAAVRSLKACLKRAGGDRKWLAVGRSAAAFDEQGLGERKLGPGERTSVVRAHSFKQISTRKYHLGPHAIELQLNGVRYGRAEFDLVEG